MKSVFIPSCFLLSLLSQQVIAANQEVTPLASAVKLDKQTISTSRGGARIEVIHGANASMGLGASGGIINIITRKNSDIQGPQGKGVQQHVNTSVTSADNFEGDSLEYTLGYSIAGKKDSLMC
jgi:outer membrane receptor for ferrienterochelin and colicin